MAGFIDLAPQYASLFGRESALPIGAIRTGFRAPTLLTTGRHTLAVTLRATASLHAFLPALVAAIPIPAGIGECSRHAGQQDERYTHFL
jgi:hypothetical protein